MLPIKAGWLVTLIVTTSFGGAAAGYGVATARASATITCAAADIATRPHGIIAGEVNRTPGHIW